MKTYIVPKNICDLEDANVNICINCRYFLMQKGNPPATSIAEYNDLRASCNNSNAKYYMRSIRLGTFSNPYTQKARAGCDYFEPMD